MKDITVKKLENNHYIVYQGNKYSDQLGYDEMLGLFVALTMPNEILSFKSMLTREQHEERQDYFDSLKNKTISEGLLKIDNSDEA